MPSITTVWILQSDQQKGLCCLREVLSILPAFLVEASPGRARGSPTSSGIRSTPFQLILSDDLPGHATVVSLSFHPILLPITDAILRATSWASSPARGTQITSSPATPSIAALTWSSSWSRHNSGTPGLCIPAFSVAILGRVSPRTSEWSIEIVVIAQMSASTSLVESSLPPGQSR